MARTLAGRRILLTGASSGIGRCLAEGIARKGARLIVSARSVDKLDELAGRLKSAGADVLAVSADVTSPEDRQQLLDTA
ncbi:MAG: SDR family NAD(P)-dependent oxidoreductase, partial [Planctomycetia bacterium]|nr:SDR family NAD(P)-dependent oxidoreductase [Planctomycetia bacterium]